MSPTAAHRLRTAALTDMQEAVWATPLGWLYLDGKISGGEFMAGRRWCELMERYAKAVQAPRPPQSARLIDAPGNQRLDPDSPEGRREARRHAKTQEWFEGATSALAHAGALRARAVAQVCEQNRLPVGFEDLGHLRVGLQTLVTYWSGKTKIPPA